MYRPGIGEVELPNEIERALEEQRLVFFCGAGVSVYTGLPLFKGLVEDVFERTYRRIHELSGDNLEPAKTAFCAGQYDRALGLLEQALTPGTMRRAVIDELSKQYDGELLLHKAILGLARVPGGGYHLVTTNFDARFGDAGLEERWVHDAPRLAPPRPHDWHHATYLHGRIKADDDPDGRHLVLTSADFGRAYLQDGWAARFIVELFREFTVLFIGYSVEDPVMSYLVDALAAHRRRSQQFRTAFAMVGFDDEAPDDRDARVREWQAKNIEPITFPKAKPDDYTAMNDALVAWAEDHRLGLQSRINTALRATNQAYLQRDKEAEQVVWALSKHDGSVANAFATAEPPADASWLKAFEEIEVFQADGQRFKLISFLSVTANNKPQSGGGSPLAGPYAGLYATSRLSRVTHQIGVWISRHLDSKEVVQWVAQQRGMLHPDFAGVIAWRLRWEEYPISELNRRFWSIVLLLIRRPSQSIYDLSGLARVSSRESEIRRRVIIEALRPTLTIAPPFGSWFDEQGQIQKRMRDLADIEINLNDEGGVIADETLTGDLLIGLSDEFTSLLAEALQFGRLADLVEASGHSNWEIRSIADHPAPSEHLDRWTVLVTLARDAFMALQKHDR